MFKIYCFCSCTVVSTGYAPMHQNHKSFHDHCQVRTDRRPTYCISHKSFHHGCGCLHNHFSHVKYFKSFDSVCHSVYYLTLLLFYDLCTLIQRRPLILYKPMICTSIPRYVCRRRWWITHPCHDQCESSSSSSTKGDQQSWHKLSCA
jgi:hypothetical protein